MPYKDKKKAKQYYHERYLRRKENPDYKKKQREYYLEHKESFKSYNDNYRKRNREKLRLKSKENYIKNQDYYKEYRLKHSEKNRQYQKQYKIRNPGKIKALNQKYQAEHAEKLKVYKKEKNLTVWGDAVRKLNYAKRKRKIKQRPCEVCGDENSQAHHYDYNKPLDVMWLCPKHHAEWHENNTPIYRKEQDEQRNC